MELIKNIAAIVGCISAIIALIGTVVRPVRKKFVNWIRHTSEATETSVAIQELNKTITALGEKIDAVESKVDKVAEHSKESDSKLLERMDDIDKRIETLDKRVFENERDRIKAELSEYASRCARNIKIYPEEMTHINEIYYKYHEVLGCNSFGTKMYDIIVDYYDHQEWLTS